ncbi:MAG: hypothetical protein ACK5M7_00265 [Draconibacterium sp.]
MKNLIFLTTIFLTTLLWSCNDIEKKTISNEETETLLTEAVTAFDLFSSMQEEAFRSSEQVEDSLKSASIVNVNYPTISIDPLDLTSWPKTIRINYGPEYIQGVDGRMRKGAIVISASNFASKVNATWIITSDDYVQDGYEIEGTQTAQYKGLNANNHPEYSCKIEDGTITSSTGKKFTFNQTTSREWIAGYDTHFLLTGNTEDYCDDEYLISGTHSGKSSDGYTYEMSTQQDLHTNVCCRWIMEGLLTVNLPNYDLSCQIDYRPSSETGDLCNNQAVFTIFGEQIPITLQ